LPSIVLIGKSAFTTEATVGGLIGAFVMMAPRFGIAHGLFSNEAGLGPAPIATSSAKTNNPVMQALVGRQHILRYCGRICIDKTHAGEHNTSVS
jgi:Na+/alanine symporter